MDLSSLSVIGPSSVSGVGEAMESTAILPTKSVTPATSYPLNLEFAEFKGQFCTHFTRSEAL